MKWFLTQLCHRIGPKHPHFGRMMLTPHLSYQPTLVPFHQMLPGIMKIQLGLLSMRAQFYFQEDPLHLYWCQTRPASEKRRVREFPYLLKDNIRLTDPGLLLQVLVPHRQPQVLILMLLPYLLGLQQHSDPQRSNLNSSNSSSSRDLVNWQDV